MVRKRNNNNPRGIYVTRNNIRYYDDSSDNSFCLLLFYGAIIHIEINSTIFIELMDYIPLHQFYPQILYIIYQFEIQFFQKLINQDQADNHHILL